MRDPSGGLNFYLFTLNNPISLWDYLGLKSSIRGTFLFEVRAVFKYWDLVKIHFSDKNIYVEDLRYTNHIVLTPETKWTPEELEPNENDKYEFPEEVSDGLQAKITPTVNVTGDDVGKILLVIPVKGKWKLRITGSINPDMDNCACYEIDYKVTAKLTFLGIKKIETDKDDDDPMFEYTGKSAGGSKTENGTLGNCKGKKLIETWPLNRDINLHPMLIYPLGLQAIKGSSEISLTIKGYE